MKAERNLQGCLAPCSCLLVRGQNPVPDQLLIHSLPMGCLQEYSFFCSHLLSQFFARTATVGTVFAGGFANSSKAILPRAQRHVATCKTRVGILGSAFASRKIGVGKACLASGGFDMETKRTSDV